MASKKDKNSKTTKTAHVLNLITTPAQRQAAAQKQAEAEAEISSAAADAAGAAAPVIPSRPLTPPIVEVAHTQDEKIASQIRSALNSELEQLANENNAALAPPETLAAELAKEVAALEAELAPAAQAAPEPEPAPAAQAAPEPEPAPAAQAAPEPAPAAQAAPEPEPAPAAQAAPEPEPAPAAQAAPEPEPAPAAQAAPEPEPAPVAQAAPEPEPAPAAQAAPEPEPAPAAQAAPEPEPAPAAQAAPEPEPAPAPESTPEPAHPAPPLPSLTREQYRPDFRGPAPTPQSGSDLLYVNIMQTIVESMAPRYIKRFGVCKCSRCAADVKALTLTNLAPKYAVFHRRDRIPMLTVYENRYGSLIAAQLTKACSIVKINPHHR